MSRSWCSIDDHNDDDDDRENMVFAMRCVGEYQRDITRMVWCDLTVQVIDDLDNFCRVPTNETDATQRTPAGKDFYQLLKDCDTLRFACVTSHVHSSTVLQNCVNT